MPFGRALGAGFAGSGLRVEYILVNGGSGGQTGLAFNADGGSGAGGDVLVGTARLRRGFSGAITIGAGGAPGNTTQGSPGSKGGLTSWAGVGSPLTDGSGFDLGLGGGYNASGVPTYGWGGPSGRFSGSPPGGGFSHDAVAGRAGGAGGGAGGAASGFDGSGNAIPGPGIINAYSGASVEYGRGGYVRQNNPLSFPPGTGGQGGWGSNNVTQGTAGTAGIAIVRYPLGNGIPRATGGIITGLGGYIIHTFTFNDTFFVL